MSISVCLTESMNELKGVEAASIDHATMELYLHGLCEYTSIIIV